MLPFQNYSGGIKNKRADQCAVRLKIPFLIQPFLFLMDLDVER